MATVSAYKARQTHVDGDRTTSQEEYIHNYSQEALSAYEKAGCTAIAEMDDGTEQVVPWSSVRCPAKEPVDSYNAAYGNTPLRTQAAPQSKAKGAVEDYTPVLSPNGTLMMRVFDDRVEVVGDFVVKGTIRQQEEETK